MQTTLSRDHFKAQDWPFILGMAFANERNCLSPDDVKVISKAFPDCTFGNPEASISNLTHAVSKVFEEMGLKLSKCTSPTPIYNAAVLNAICGWVEALANALPYPYRSSRADLMLEMIQFINKLHKAGYAFI